MKEKIKMKKVVNTENIDIEDLREEFRKSERKFSVIAAKLQRAEAKISKAKIDKLFDNGKKVNAKSIMAIDTMGESSYAQYYRSMEDYIVKQPGCWPGLNFYLYNDPQNSQKEIKVMFDQDKSFNKQLGILKFIPYLKPVVSRDLKTKAADKIIGIFEAGLAENGVYNLQLHGDEWRIVHAYYTRETVKFKDKDLKKALHYAYERLPYKGKSVREREDRDRDRNRDDEIDM